MRNNRPKVMVVLLNYRGAEDTIDCLQSLLDISYPNYRIIIVDNDSPDESFGKIEQHLKSGCIEHFFCHSSDMMVGSGSDLPLVTLIQSGRNGGYGYGNNIGIKYALANKADYVLILNNDTVVDPGFLEPLVQKCEDDDCVGITTGKIYFYDRPDVLWFNGGKYHPYTTKIEHINFNEKDIGQQPPSEITFISGCMWLIPKQIFAIVGYINEEYFMYVEDLEYCQRVLEQGYTLNVCEKSKLWHKVGNASGGYLSEFSVYWTARNQFKFFCSRQRFIYQIMGIINLVIIVPIKLLKSNKEELIPIHFKGIGDAIRG